MSKLLLADRMRPENLNDYVGQTHIIGEGKLLRRAIEADLLRSLILYGPPGTGKTSLAHVISNIADSRFVKLDATGAKISDLRDVIDMAKKMLQGTNRKTIVFIDEIHRFTSNQQDVLLPSTEDGTIILIGATTENPFFEVNGALLSRSRIFELKPLSVDEIKTAMISALEKDESLKQYKNLIDNEHIEIIADMSNGDLRVAFNSLEFILLTTNSVVTQEIIEEAMQKRVIRYDKGGTEHYNVFSAFSKSMRAGRTSAALHYFARMIEGGEAPKSIMRRVMAHASEDVGLANPQALLTAVAAFQALEVCGWPEARLPMAQAIIYVCESPKSNSVYNAINAAFEDVKNKKLGDVPLHIKDAHSKGLSEDSIGEEYIYPHNIPGNWTPNQEYLPNNLVGADYYKPSNNGHEAKIKLLRKERIERYNKLLE